MSNLKKHRCPQRRIPRGLAVCILKIPLLILCPIKLEDLCSKEGQKKNQGQKLEQALTLKTQTEKDEPASEGKREQSER